MKSIKNLILEDAKHCQEEARKDLTGRLPPSVLDFVLKQILTDAEYFAKAFPPDAVPVSRLHLKQLLDIVMKTQNLSDAHKQVLIDIQKSLNDEGGGHEMAN